MSMIADAGRRCLHLVRQHTDIEDETLHELCIEDLRAGFKYLQDHLIHEVVDYYVKNRRKFQ